MFTQCFKISLHNINRHVYSMFTCLEQGWKHFSAILEGLFTQCKDMFKPRLKTWSKIYIYALFERCSDHIWRHIQTFFKTSLHNVWRDIYVMFEDMIITPRLRTFLQNVWHYSKIIYITFQGTLSLWMKTCLHKVLRHLYTLFEDLFIQCLKPCKHKVE